MLALSFKVMYYIKGHYNVLTQEGPPSIQFGYVANSKLCDVCPLISIVRVTGRRGFLRGNESGLISIVSNCSLPLACPRVVNSNVSAPVEEVRPRDVFSTMGIHPECNTWFSRGNILSSVQARETCRVTEEHAESMVTLRVKEQ